MFNSGLLWKYKTGRPITDEERKLALGKASMPGLEPAPQLSVIRLNSYYLEVLDKYFSWRGWLTLGSLIVVFLSCLVASGVVAGLWQELQKGASANRGYLAFDAGMLLFMFVPLLSAAAWLFSKDSFRYTHYPIRLDRKNRMVYVFRLDGTVLTAAWDELFFTLARENSFVMRGPQFWEIQGHVLGEDGVTVKETFAFHDVEGPEVVRRHWEFLRRYMENGPEDLVHRVQHYAPVDQRRETFSEGLRRIFANDSGFLWAQIVAAPINVLIACGRWISMRTSKIPQWPPEVEAACRLEPGDPYERDARTAVAANR